MSGPSVDWDADVYEGGVNHLGPDPYSLSSQTPDTRADTQGSMSQPFGQLAGAIGNALNRNNGLTVDTVAGNGSLGTVDNSGLFNVNPGSVPDYAPPIG